MRVLFVILDFKSLAKPSVPLINMDGSLNFHSLSKDLDISERMQQQITISGRHEQHNDAVMLFGIYSSR